MRPKVPIAQVFVALHGHGGAHHHQRFSSSAVQRHMLTATARFTARWASFNLVHRAAASKVGGCALMRHTRQCARTSDDANNIPALAQVGNEARSAGMPTSAPSLGSYHGSRAMPDPQTNCDPLECRPIARESRSKACDATQPYGSTGVDGEQNLPRPRPQARAAVVGQDARFRSRCESSPMFGPRTSFDPAATE
jgi:hypothetical protein